MITFLYLNLTPHQLIDPAPYVTSTICCRVMKSEIRHTNTTSKANRAEVIRASDQCNGLFNHILTAYNVSLKHLISDRVK